MLLQQISVQPLGRSITGQLARNSPRLPRSRCYLPDAAESVLSLKGCRLVKSKDARAVREILLFGPTKERRSPSATRSSTQRGQQLQETGIIVHPNIIILPGGCTTGENTRLRVPGIPLCIGPTRQHRASPYRIPKCIESSCEFVFPVVNFFHSRKSSMRAGNCRTAANARGAYV